MVQQEKTEKRSAPLITISLQRGEQSEQFGLPGSRPPVLVQNIRL